MEKLPRTHSPPPQYGTPGAQPQSFNNAYNGQTSGTTYFNGPHSGAQPPQQGYYGGQSPPIISPGQGQAQSPGYEMHQQGQAQGQGYQYGGQQQPQQAYHQQQQQYPQQHQQQQQQYHPPMQQPHSQGPGQGPTYNTVVPLANLMEISVPVDCPSCHQRAMTVTRLESGNTTFLWAVVVGVFTGLCCIPFFINSLKDVHHSCGKCGVPLATWRRSGRTEVRAYG